MLFGSSKSLNKEYRVWGLSERGYVHVLKFLEVGGLCPRCKKHKCGGGEGLCPPCKNMGGGGYLYIVKTSGIMSANTKMRGVLSNTQFILSAACLRPLVDFLMHRMTCYSIRCIRCVIFWSDCLRAQPRFSTTFVTAELSF